MINAHEGDDKKLKAPSLLHSFAIIVLLLFSISIFNLTVRSLFGPSLTPHNRKSVNLLYDQDANQNWSMVCPMQKTLDNVIHNFRWNESTCFNKTLLHWHIPWLRAWLWDKVSQLADERNRLIELEKRRREEELAQKEIEAQTVLPNVDVENEEKIEKDKIPVEKEKEVPTNVVYTILTAMTLMLTILACLEIFREKFSKKTIEDAKDPGRRCSLADFTINRHLRKQSQQESLQRQAAFDEPKKVKEFLHQGSLDRAFSVLTPTVSSRLPRQSSMPSRPTTCIVSEPRVVPSLQALRKPSVDLSEEDGSPSMRRKSRHFIRRH